VLLFFALLALWVFSNIAFFVYRGPFWFLSPLLNLLCVHGAFTILHESAHKNIFRSRYGWGNDLMGMCAGIIMHGAFEQFIAIHLKHHAAVNDPENDPDYHAHGPITPKRILIWMFTVYHYFREFFRLHLWKGRNYYLLVAPYLLIGVLYAVAFRFNEIPAVLVLYVVPALIGAAFTVYFFDHLPHHPHRDRSRYGNASVYDTPALNWFFMGHSFHIVHHLWPSIPWYRYREIYHRARPELLAAGVHETTIRAQL